MLTYLCVLRVCMQSLHVCMPACMHKYMSPIQSKRMQVLSTRDTGIIMPRHQH